MTADPNIDPAPFMPSTCSAPSRTCSEHVDDVRAGADVRRGRRDLRRAVWRASAERVNDRNGYRPRECDTRAGTIDVAIPKLREGSYFPDWLLERRRGPSGR